MARKPRGPTILIYCTAEERDALDAGATKAGVSRQVFMLRAALAASGDVLYVPADLSRKVRAEAKRRKLEPQTLLATWIVAAAGKDPL